MATTDFQIKAGDTLPVLTDTLTYSDGSAVNLTGASVNFVMRSLYSTMPIVNAAATITNASTGAVSFTFTSTQSAVAGSYDATWSVTFSGGQTMSFPTDGYMSIVIEDSLTSSTSAQQLVSVADAKQVLNFASTDRSSDEKIRRWINAVRPLVEAITGPIIPTVWDEWHDGGQYHIMLRRAPSTGYGTSPLLNLMACSIYIGPIEYSCSIVGNPVIGSIYTVMADTYSRVVRRGPGGGIIPFPNNLQSVHVVYQSGQQTVPDNVYEATLELLRVNYQQTQQATRRGYGGGGTGADDSEPTGAPLGFFVPNRVRELLAPTRKGPSIF